jgi:CRP-like cAMP-binding protein
VSILSNSPNHFLRSLSLQDAELLQPLLKLVELPSGTVLYRTDETITRVYFPYTGIVSYVIGVTSGELVEAGMIGRNSAVGAGAPLDGAIAINEAIVQVAMSGAAVESGLLKQIAAGSDTLRAWFARHEDMVLAQVQQVAACNALHSLEERLSRWLLQARDLLNADVLPLTQDFLSQMLGVHRSSLTLVAGRLQEAGLIDYHRGSIKVRDVEALKDVSCECYGVINAHFFRLVGWSPDFNG